MCGIAGSFTSFFLIKFIGRRPIVIGGAAAQGTSMMTFAIVAVAAPGSLAASKCLAAFVCLFIFSYGATWGAVSQVLLGELSSTKLRSKTVALATAAGWVSDILIICGIPYLLSADYANLGGKVGFIFGGCQIIVLLYSIFYIPETKDRTLEEIDEMFMNVSPPNRPHLEAVANHRIRKFRLGNLRATKLRKQFKAYLCKARLRGWKRRTELLLLLWRG